MHGGKKMKRTILTIKCLILIGIFSTIGYGQIFWDNKGLDFGLYAGSLDIAGEMSMGKQYGARTSFWFNPYMNLGLDGIYGRKNSLDKNIYKIHSFAGIHTRFFKYVNPYIVGSLGTHIIPKKIYKNKEKNNNYTKENIYYFGATIKLGLALEIKNMRFAIENGGGTFGTGHTETNFIVSHALKLLPKPSYVSNFSLVGGLHYFYDFLGPYKGSPDYGFDFVMTKEKNGRIREYNAGIFFTDYRFSTGCFNFGTGWRIGGDSKIFDYLSITPGYQILLWAEGDPDIILPAASLGLGLEYKIGVLVPYIKSRTLLTYSTGKEFIMGNTISYGFGIQF